MSEGELTTVVSAFIISRSAAGNSQTTVHFYEQQLGYFLRYLESPAMPRLAQPRPTSPGLADLTSEAIENYLAQRQGEVKPRSVHCAWRAIRALCNWLGSRTERYPDWVNPVPKITPPRLPRTKAPPADQPIVDQMLKACRGHDKMTDRDRAILLVLVSSGLRSCELLGLKQEHIDLHTGEVTVLHGKGDIRRMAIISPTARLAVADYLSHLDRSDPSQPLWWGRKGPLSYGGLCHLLTALAKRAGVSAVSAHALRRRWATNMAPHLTPWVLQSLGGWSSFESVKPYISLNRDELLAAYREATNGR